MVLPQHAQHTLLPVATAELVSNDWIPVQAGLDVHLRQCLAAGANDGDLVNNGCFLSLLPALPLTLCITQNTSKHTKKLLWPFAGYLVGSNTSDGPNTCKVQETQ